MTPEEFNTQDGRAGLDALRQLVPSLARAFPDVEALYVFGSVASGCSNDGSDLDIGVYLSEHGAEPDALADLKLGQWLEDHLGRHIDVVVMNRASSILQHEILRTGSRLYERSSASRAAYELRAFKCCVDMRYYQNKREEALAHHGQ